jgi:hypothetical protein
MPARVWRSASCSRAVTFCRALTPPPPDRRRARGRIRGRRLTRRSPGPAASLRARPDRLTGEAAALNRISPASHRHRCLSADGRPTVSHPAQLLRLDAAEFSADAATVTALATACRRGAALLETDLDERFAEADPLADPLRADAPDSGRQRRQRCCGRVLASCVREPVRAWAWGPSMVMRSASAGACRRCCKVDADGSRRSRSVLQRYQREGIRGRAQSAPAAGCAVGPCAGNWCTCA